MCRPVTCKTCGKTTWAGCGQHVEEVRRTVPASQWCPGHDKEEKGAGAGGFLARLLGR
ncbi:hypothetical protein [Salana multivorans]